MAKKFKNILVVGGSGLLGSAMRSELISRHYKVLAPTSEDLDVTDQELVLEFLRHNWPDLIINCAGYTDVDENEGELEINPELINNYGAVVLAAVARDIGIRIAHVSTSYVFDGIRKEPYVETDRPSPVSRYGRLKLAAERAMIAENPTALILRTSWLFGPGRTNFVSLVARKAQVGDTVEAAKDVVSAPTYSLDLAEGFAELLEKDAKGIVHLTNSGTVSRYELARTALKQLGLPGGVEAVPAELVYRAKRPPHAVLSTELAKTKYSVTLRPWNEALTDYITKFKQTDILLSEDMADPREE
jgi:dTDP-4-dehydrorhamnose reductase